MREEYERVSLLLNEDSGFLHLSVLLYYYSNILLDCCCHFFNNSLFHKCGFALFVKVSDHSTTQNQTLNKMSFVFTEFSQVLKHGNCEISFTLEEKKRSISA